MPLSNLAYVNPEEWEDPPAVPYLCRVIQGETPEVLAASAQQVLDEVQALNVEIAAAFPETPGLGLQVADLALAGGGDGHTFIVTMTFVAESLNVAAAMLSAGGMSPQDITVRFALAGDAAELETAWNSVVNLASLDADDPSAGVQVFWQQAAGASKGTRFMVMVGYSDEAPVPPDEE